MVKQAGAEQGQAQLKLGLYFTLIKIYYMKKYKNQNLIVENFGSFEKLKFSNWQNDKASLRATYHW